MTMLKMTMAAALLAVAGCGVPSDGPRYSGDADNGASDYYADRGPGSYGDPGYGSGVYFDGNGAGASLEGDHEYGGGVFFTGNDAGADYYYKPGNDAGNAPQNADLGDERGDGSGRGGEIRR